MRIFFIILGLIVTAILIAFALGYRLIGTGWTWTIKKVVPKPPTSTAPAIK